MPITTPIPSDRDLFYRGLVRLGRFPMWVTSRPIIVEAHHAAREGGYILASNHFSPYDIPILMRSTPRRLDFVSIIEFFQKPFVAWLFSNMNAFPLDRHHADPKTVRLILDRLARGRVIAMFPEGDMRNEQTSVVNGGPFRAGLLRIATLANVPIIPVVIDGSAAYSNLINMLPLRRVRYGLIYGQPIDVRDEQEATAHLANSWRTLYKQLRERMTARGPKCVITPSASSVASS